MLQDHKHVQNFLPLSLGLEEWQEKTSHLLHTFATDLPEPIPVNNRPRWTVSQISHPWKQRCRCLMHYIFFDRQTQKLILNSVCYICSNLSELLSFQKYRRLSKMQLQNIYIVFFVFLFLPNFDWITRDLEKCAHKSHPMSVNTVNISPFLVLKHDF